jgi:hypothetical protein
MENDKTVQPGSEDYNVEKPQDLNIPKYNSATEKRDSNELPSDENMHDQEKDTNVSETHDTEMPSPNLGNKRDHDEEEKEKIIRR